MSEDPGTREHPTYYCWAMPPIHIIYICIYTLGIILGISQRISRLGILLKQHGLVAKTALH